MIKIKNDKVFYKDKKYKIVKKELLNYFKRPGFDISVKISADDEKRNKNLDSLIKLMIEMGALK